MIKKTLLPMQFLLKCMYKTTILLFIGFMCQQMYGQDSFITTWKTDNPGFTNSTSIRISPYTTGWPNEYDVDWENDGTWDTLGVTGNATHDYAIAGTYTVAIRGTLPHFYAGSDSKKLLSIDQWGDLEWGDMTNAFAGCINMQYNAVDTPNLTNVTIMRNTFSGCLLFNGDVGGWNTSNVTNMTALFGGCIAFNQDIGGWNTSNVTTMQSMFSEATNFNQDIGAWNTGKVTNMSMMFIDAEYFNQDISGWNTSEVSNMRAMFKEASAFNQDIGGWNTGKVENMQEMFFQAENFNQDIGGWNTGSVTNISYMFYSATAFNQDIGGWNTGNVTNMLSVFAFAPAFNQDIGSWNTANVEYMGSMFVNTPFDQNIGGWDVSSVSYMNNMFNGCTLSVENYDSLLIGWSSLDTLQPNNDFHGGYSKYCDGANARQLMIDTFGWTITDQGAASSTNAWIGPPSGDWNDPANWASGFVPKLCDDVEVPTNISIIIMAGETATCNALDIGPGSIIDVQPGATLHVVNP